MLPVDANTMREIAPRFSRSDMIADQKHITDAIGALLVETLSRYEINTRLRLAHFFGQTCEETAGFRTLTEFASGEAYEGRVDLGNTHPGDGKKFKGRGIIDTTGVYNYKRVGQEIGKDLITHPELAAEPSLALEIACHFWQDHNLNRYADRDDLLTITRIINGGTNGLADRRTYTSNAKNVLARMEALVIHGAQGTVAGADRPVVHRGMTGNAVEALQRTLDRLGYKVTIDGDFGPGTEKVVEAFQTACKLSPVDGIVGRDSWEQIDIAIEHLDNAKTVPT